MLFIFAAFVVFNAPKVFCQTNANDFSVTTIDGKTYDSAKLRGKIIVVNLWYINCPNCFEEIRQLNKLVDDYQAEQNVIFLGLAADNAAKLKTFLNKNPFKYQIVPSAANLMIAKFGTPGKNGQINIPFPTHIVINAQGEKVLNVAGIKGVEAVRNELKKELKGK